MVINDIEETKAISEDKINILRQDLIAFSQKITEARKKESRGKRYPQDILIYSEAVTKSTTDKDRRINRHKILKKIILKHLN